MEPRGEPAAAGRTLPYRLSQKKALDLLREHGWTDEPGGKHQIKMTKAGERPITLPQHKHQDYGPQLTNAILTQAGLK